MRRRFARQLLGVAEAAYKEARAADLLPKAKSPESRRGAAEQHVEAIYTIHHSDWPAVTAQYGGNGDYEFAVTHLHIVKSARMKLTQGSLVAYNDAALQRKLGIAEARVQERFAGDLGQFSGSHTHRRERLEGRERNCEGEATGNYGSSGAEARREAGSAKWRRLARSGRTEAGGGRRSLVHGRTSLVDEHDRRQGRPCDHR